jgi:hypothetical protein
MKIWVAMIKLRLENQHPLYHPEAQAAISHLGYL